MKISNPSKEEFMTSRILKRLVWDKNIISGGKKQLDSIAKSLNYDTKYPWIYEAIFHSVASWAEKYPLEYSSSIEYVSKRNEDRRIASVYALDVYANWIIVDYLAYIIANNLGFDIKSAVESNVRKIQNGFEHEGYSFMLKTTEESGWIEIRTLVSYTMNMGKNHKFIVPESVVSDLENGNVLILKIELPSKIFILTSSLSGNQKYEVKSIGEGFCEISIIDLDEIKNFSELSNEMNKALESLYSKKRTHQDDDQEEIFVPIGSIDCFA